MPKTTKTITLPPAEELERMKMKLGNTGWTVGKFLGQGVQGSVHKVVGTYEFPLAVKITPTPQAYTFLGRPLKGKAALKQLNSTAGYLNGETNIYKASHRFGGIVPKILPLSLLAKGGIGGITAEGYRYLIMEEMAMPLEDAVGLLVKEARKGGVLLGPMAVRLVEICQTVHERQHTAVDVKLDNFMVAHTSAASPASLAERLRIVDLALFQQIRKDPQPVSGGLSGNAMYCSPDMHTMQGGRGDDLFMFLMVLADLLIRVKAEMEGKKDLYEGTKIPSYLPWSQLPDDDAILASKKTLLADLQSDLYQRMPKDCAKTMHALFKKSLGYGYHDVPKYDEFSAALKGMVIPMAAPVARATKPKASPRKAGAKAKAPLRRTKDVTNLKKPPRPKGGYKLPPALKSPPRPPASRDMEDETPTRRVTRTARRGKP